LLFFAKFAYNFSIYLFISKTPFKVIYIRTLKLNIIIFKKVYKYFAKKSFTEIKNLVKKFKFTREEVKTAFVKNLIILKNVL